MTIILWHCALHSTTTKQLCLLPPGEFSLDDSKRLCVLTLEKALKQLPEGQDTVLGIFDLRGFKQKNGDLGFAGFLVSTLSCCSNPLHLYEFSHGNLMLMFMLT